MGALCGKESKTSDPFAQPGRTLGSAPPQPSRSSVPAERRSRGQTGQTLGGSQPTVGKGDARSAAASAAEVGHELAPRFKKYPDAGRLLTML